MAFVHGHARESGWVVSHYRRPQRAGDEQLDLDLPAPRPADGQVCETSRAVDADPDGPAAGDPDDDPDASRESVRSIPRRTASTR
jgi:hypothetical protein